MVERRKVASILLVPIVFAGEVVGLLEITDINHREFTPIEIELSEKVTSQVGQVLERLGLFAATREQADRMAHLASISEGLNRPFTLEEVIKGIGEGAMALGRATRCILFLWEMDGKIRAPWSVGVSPTYVSQVLSRIEEMVGAILLQNAEPVLISDIEALPESSLFRQLGSAEGFRTINLWPLVYKDVVIAAIGCYYDQVHYGSDAEHEVLLAFARQAAIALQNARLFDEARRRAVQLEALNAIITEAAAASDLKNLLKIALDHTLRALGLHRGAIWVGTQQVIRDFPRDIGKISSNIPRPPEFEMKDIIAVADWENVPTDVAYAPYASVMSKYNARATIVAPLISAGRRIGGLALASDQPRTWLEEEIALLEGVGSQLGGAVRRMELLEKIQENARQVQQIVDTVPEGVILLDGSRQVVMANPVAQEFLLELGGVRTGDTLNELGNKPLDDLLRIDAQVLWYELDIEGPPHRLFELASQPLAIGDPSGGWVVVMRDVTHEREYQTRIQMQERLATVGQLASGIAHDFNNILAAIVVYSDLLKRDPNLTAAGRERLAIIQQQVNRAASLIRQILDFSRRSMIEQSLMDMLPFIKELDKLLRRILPETIRLELSYQPGSYMVNADPTHLQQVFMNLAVNARDASPQGGTLYFKLERVEIKRGDLNPCPIVSPGNWIRITVQDTGEGIPPEILPHVFEPFFTTKPIGQGTGLGLAQAYGIIKQHDGYIDAHSQVGEGSTFHIYLPAQDSPDELMISHESVPEVLGTGETLLVVEDDLSTREAMRELLEAYNYQVLTAANGKEALQVYASNSGQIDLVVSDIVMPEMGGVALYQTLVERWPDVRMLFVTGHPIKDKDQAILRAGNVHWLQKPFSVNSFSQVLQGLLRSEGNDFHD
jgi:signal transduction histidine kinase/ActR/RegA family two-component response regulator